MSWVQGQECTYISTHNTVFTSKEWNNVIIVIIHVKILEAKAANITIWILIIEGLINIAFHLMKQIQVIHKLVKYIASTALQ